MALVFLSYNTTGSSTTAVALSTTFSAPPIGTRIFVWVVGTVSSIEIPNWAADGWTRETLLTVAGSSSTGFGYLFHKIVSTTMTSVEMNAGASSAKAIAAFYGDYDVDTAATVTTIGALNQDTVNLGNLGGHPTKDGYVAVLSARSSFGLSFTFSYTGVDSTPVSHERIGVAFDLMAAGAASPSRTADINVTSTSKHGHQLFRLTEFVEIGDIIVNKGVMYVATLYSEPPPDPGDVIVNKGVLYVAVAPPVEDPPMIVNKGVLYVAVAPLDASVLSVKLPAGGPVTAKWKLDKTYPYVKINDQTFETFLDSAGTYTFYLMAPNGDFLVQSVTVDSAQTITIPIKRSFNQIARVKTADTLPLRESVYQRMLARRLLSSGF